MKALLRVALAAALVGAIGFAMHASEVEAELDSQVFTSKPDGIRIVVPRNWRATDAAGYPGVLLWMMRSEPEGRIALTAEPFTREMYCSWPVTCRTGHDTLAAKYACALRDRLGTEHMKLDAPQAGPKENAAAGMDSIWFEYDDGKHFLRQAVALTPDRAVSLVLSAGSVDARATLARPFDQALRTLRPLTAAEAAGSDVPSGAVRTAQLIADGGAVANTTAPSGDGGALAGADAATGSALGGAGHTDGGAVADAGARDASIELAPPPDAGRMDAGISFQSAPPPSIPPVGPCP